MRLQNQVEKFLFLIIFITSFQIITGLAHAAAFDNIVVILMENHGINEIIGTATYMTNLANSNSLATHYTGVVHPSEGNYVAMIGGDTFGFTSDCGYCPWRTNAPNIIDRIEASGRTWKAFAEDASGSGTCSFQPPRGGDHFAFITFSDLNTPSRCANFLTTSSSTDAEFISALNAPNPPNFVWLTPIDNNNMHDNSVSSGDSYIANLVPQILNSTMFKTRNATLLIVFDEGNDACPSGGSGDCVYTVFAGPVAKKNYTSAISYNHYSFLKTIETVWNLPSLTSNDAGATAMTEFFTGFSGGNNDFSVLVNPTSGNVEQGMQTTVKITASGPASTVTLSQSGCPASTTCTFNPTSGSSPSTSTLTIISTSSTPTGTFSINILANNGTATRSAPFSLTVTPPLPFDFNVSLTTASVSVNPGNSTSNVVSVNLFSGSPQSVSLSANCPSGITCTFIPSSGNPSFSSTLNILTSSSTPLNTYTIIVIGTSGSTTRTSSFSLDVTNSIQQSSNYTLNWAGFDWDGAGEVTVTLNGHSLGSLPLSASTQNAQVFTPFSQDISSYVVQGTNTLAFQHANSDCGVNDNVRNLQVTSGSTVVYSNSTELTLNCTQSLTYTFNAQGIVSGLFDFSISTPSSTSVGKGSTVSTTIDVVAVSGTPQPVSLSVTCPSSVTCTVSPVSGTPPFSSTLQITTTNSTSLGDIPVTISAISGSASKTSTVTVTVSSGIPEIRDYLLWGLAGIIVLGCLAIIMKKIAGA